jgi:hypothetical protein
MKQIHCPNHKKIAKLINDIILCHNGKITTQI